MRMLALLLISLPVFASGPELSDVDVESITKVTVYFLHASPSYISNASAACTLTAEQGCTLEVWVAAEGPRYITVSKIDGVWAVGKWQREIMTHEHCLQDLRSKEAKEDALGITVDRERRRKDHAACNGPDGHYGGVRGQ